MTPSVAPPVADLLDLTGQTVLVTGASGNIGQVIAMRLAEAGATIIAHHHRHETVARALLDSVGAGEIVAADLSDKQAIDEMITNTKPTLLVNNAARHDVQNLSDITLADWQMMMAVNLDAVFLLTQRVAAAWSERGGGARSSILHPQKEWTPRSMQDTTRPAKRDY